MTFMSNNVKYQKLFISPGSSSTAMSDVNLATEQLLELLLTLKVNTPLSLLLYSFGLKGPG